MADRDSILDNSFAEDGMEDAYREITTKPYKAVQNAMDEYMRLSCLELLEYMANNRIDCGFVNEEGIKLFGYKNKWLTKEQLFENFL